MGTQLASAAELVVFLACTAGLAMVLLRPGLLATGRAPGLAAGFVGIGAAAFLRGSLLVPEARGAAVLAPRLVGVALLALGAVRADPAGWSRSYVLRAAAVFAFAELADSDLLRAAAGLALVVALFLASRRSIAAQVAVGGTAAVLAVVVAVSVALSSAVVGNVEGEARRRVATRADAESDAAGTATRQAVGSARLLADVLATTRDAAVAQRLVAVATDPASPDGQAAGAAVQADLRGLGERYLLVADALAFVTDDAVVVPALGLDQPSEQIVVAGSPVVRDALATRGEAGAPFGLGGRAVVAGAAPVTVTTPGGPVFVGAVFVAEPLDAAYLQVRRASEPELSLALVGRDGVLAADGPQPAEDRLLAVATPVLDGGEGRTEQIGGRYVSVQPVLAGDTPVLAVVASAPSDLLDDTRESLFRTLFLAALVASAVAVALAAVVGERIGAGLRRLTDGAGAIRAGDLDVRVGLDRDDELGVLGSAFDGMAGSLRTMTDELREAAIDEARLRNRLEAVVAGMGEALVVVDADGLVTDVNAAGEALFGVAAGEARRRSLDDLGLAGDVVRRPDGEEVPVGVTSGVVRGPTGEAAGTVLVVRDLRREREIERMKTEFLSNISHELRTPLTPIKGYAELLAHRDIPPERARAFAEEIGAGADQLERVVGQLVAYAAIAAGRLEVEKAPVPVRDVLDSVAARWSARLDGGHAVVRRVARGTPPVDADRALLEQSLDELIDNAVKYSPGGGRILVTAEAGTNGSSHTVRLSVHDRGVGMAPDRLASLLGGFAQGDASATRAVGGLGLGLTLVDAIAEAHGGSLECSSTPGRGTTFTLLLPAAPT